MSDNHNTHRTVYPISWNLTPKSRSRKRPYIPEEAVRPRTCEAACAGLHDCCLNANVPHEWHICDDPLCKCHEEYRDAKPK